MVRLVTITTHSSSTNVLLRGQLAYLRERGMDVIAIASPGEQLDEAARREQIRAIGVPIEREIRPLRDIVSLMQLYRLLRSLRPDIVNAGTSKAGLLGMLASRLAGVPVRVYTLRGLRFETARGLKRWVLRLVEHIAARCATRVVCVSSSLEELFLAEGFAPEAKTVVLGAGSSNGVDAQRFRPRAETRVLNDGLRQTHRVGSQELVIGFVGRLVRDKGIVELMAAFNAFTAKNSDARLLIVGDFEEGDPLSPQVRRQVESHPRVIWTGWLPDTGLYYAMMDILVLPSHREGFPNVPLEAAAAEVPVVAFRATGAIDAIDDGVTGTLVPKGDVSALAGALERYAGDAELRQRHGEAGRKRVLRQFTQELVWEAWFQEYLRLLGPEIRGQSLATNS